MNPEPLTLSHRRRSLFWKEWRQRRGLIALLFGLGFLIELGGINEAWIEGLGIEPGEIQKWLLGGLASGMILLGGSFLSREENEAANCWLYTLPVSRARIVLMRLILLAGIGSVMTVPVLIGWEWLAPHFVIESEAVLLVLLSIVVIPLASSIRVHLSQPLVVFIVTIVLINLSSVPIYRLVSLGPGSLLSLIAPFGFWIILAGLFVLLSAWDVFLISRTRIQELPPLARAALGLLYAATVLEVAFVLFLADPYELFILLTGGFGG